MTWFAKLPRRVGAALRKLKPNPLRRDPIWREADRQEREARARHGKTKPYQELKRQRVNELLAGH